MGCINTFYPGLFQGLGGKFGREKLIFTDVVNDLLVLLLDLDQEVTKFRIMEW